MTGPGACVILWAFKLNSPNMFGEILSQLTWIDFLIICFVVRSIYIGVAKGLYTEGFKLLGIIFSVFIAYHYFARFGQTLEGFLHFPEKATQVVAFLLLWGLTVLVVKLIRDGWSLVLKLEEPSTLSRIIGAGLGALRGCLVCGLMCACLFLTGNRFIRQNVKDSFTGVFLLDFSLETYKASFRNVVGKVYSKETLNEKALQIMNPKKRHSRSSSTESREGQGQDQ